MVVNTREMSRIEERNVGHTRYPIFEGLLIGWQLENGQMQRY